MALELVKMIIEIQQVRRGFSLCPPWLSSQAVADNKTKAKFDASSAGDGGERTSWTPALMEPGYDHDDDPKDFGDGRALVRKEHATTKPLRNEADWIWVFNAWKTGVLPSSR